MFYTTLNTFKIQDFLCEKINENEPVQVTYLCHSEATAKNVSCPHCCGKVKGHGTSKIKLHDVPFLPGIPTIYIIKRHRYQCLHCGSTFIEKDPFTFPGFRLTCKAVEWISRLLAFQIPTKTIADLMGIHWNTVRKIQQEEMNKILSENDRELMESSYRPSFLAVDEFAIHKGHRYATCVMDWQKGNILWVGKGRDIKGFQMFFEHFKGTDYLCNVKAVAMDMNASYNNLVEEYLPDAVIVYDRYHVQAQFGRDVLGQVRLAEAKKHKEKSQELSVEEAPDKKSIRTEKHLYSMIKGARWTLLFNSENLSKEKQKSLNEILESHSDLAVCYSMKEEMIELFKLTDIAQATERWTKWFDAAESSGIGPLMKFARLKRRRLGGLIAHAKYQINTGKLEGFNNKIKVAKRNAFGYRNTNYFFSLIRYLSLPKDLKGT